MNKRKKLAFLIILILIPLTIFLGIVFLRDRKYFFISSLILVYTILPFFLVFEKRNPKPRELVIIASLAALGVAGRLLFAHFPNFKPVAAITMIAGISLGPEAGFLTGALVAFLSNFFFGQGPWTPWQMFTFGLIGFLTANLSKKGVIKKTKKSLAIWGFLLNSVLFGAIMDLSAAVTWQTDINLKILLGYYLTGIPFNIIHGSATAIFLYLIGPAMINKIERLKDKYGILEEGDGNE